MIERITNIANLKSYAVSQQHREGEESWMLLLKLLYQAKLFVADEEVETVYPKKLLSSSEEEKCNENNLEVVLFTRDGKIFIAKVIDEGCKFQVELKKIEDITSLNVSGNLTEARHKIQYKAIIKFKDESELILSSKDDVNQHWQEDYCKLIISIVRSLM
ncbi:hypothetical protein [Candidatus Contubernalis alkaliaceticus]|uniref:hypothetical protein n=1 Tax=Candidatus Contubernalis alkaliaceticus TaxID=338645 RepID=UPI001F4BFFE1|nr:hypothetical protein [Candidatus Contubernalis alkalaceticus]UNC91684.1 hypothetical protein HUE98_06000 [Candidatus Contubernalis alkalaceticus]